MRHLIENKNYLLTDEEVERYHHDGYLVVKNLYDRREMQFWKEKIITLLKKEGHYNNPSGVHVFFLHDLHPYFIDKMRDPKVVKILKSLLIYPVVLLIDHLLLRLFILKYNNLIKLS